MIKAQHYRNIGKAGQYGDVAILADFNAALGTRYQAVWGVLSSYINTDTPTTPAATVAGQQYYSYPVATQSLDSVTVLVGTGQYTLNPIYDQNTWNNLNAIQIQPTSIPQFFFPRQYDFGIWPIPQAAYTITFQRFFRDRNLLVEDYTTGTVTMTISDATVLGSSVTFTQAMVGRWLEITNTAVPGQGYWYKIASVTDATHLELSVNWNAATAAGATYLIGETPELPEDAHRFLAWGTASDFYAGLRNDSSKATWFDNMFWTGSGLNSSRDIGDKNILDGLIGLCRKYQDRTRDNIVIRQPRIFRPADQIFAQTLSM